MYADDDPYLAELRELCLAFPEATEVEAWGRPTFRAKKIFAMFTGSEDERYSVIFKPDAADREALVQDPRFSVPPYWGPGGWLSLDLTAAPVDWTEVAELVEDSYRQAALQRQRKALDAQRAAADG
jgi:predicted DNA-binding protein (MmcQ/YjbR family)